MVRASFVCKGLWFQAVHVTGGRRKRARAVLLSTVQGPGWRAMTPGGYSAQHHTSQWNSPLLGTWQQTGVVGTSSRLRMLSVLHKPVQDVQGAFFLGCEGGNPPLLQGSAVPTMNPTWFLPMPSGWAGKPVPSTALGGPGSPAGCDNFCTAPGPLCQHWQQGTTPTQSCHHLPESCTSTWCFSRATLGSPAPPWRCGTNGRALGCSLSLV